jgi:hypothetical protein
MEHELKNGMVVEVGYFADTHDRKMMDIDEVKWRGIDVMHVLTTSEMDELFAACYEYEADLAAMAREDRYDAMRDGS